MSPVAKLSAVVVFGVRVQTMSGLAPGVQMLHWKHTYTKFIEDRARSVASNGLPTFSAFPDVIEKELSEQLMSIVSRGTT